MDQYHKWGHLTRGKLRVLPIMRLSLLEDNEYFWKWFSVWVMEIAMRGGGKINNRGPMVPIH